MNKLEKKLIVIFMSLTFLMSGLTTISAISIEKPKVEELGDIVSDSLIFPKKVLIYRHGPDGSITPVEVDIEPEEDQDIGEAILEELDELLENDEEIQDLLQLPNITFGLGVRIKSRGKGFHFQTLLFEKLAIKFVLFRLGLPRIAPIIAKPLIYCKYLKDPKAKTTIKTLYGFGKEKVMEGNHTVIANYFIGYTTWFRRFSISPLDIMPRAFSGFARLAFCKELL